ncbi:MAG: hypothetical protein NT007_16640 [Candidatus Kapabacteria bacterium]|nr:hypothetical protein [Candidatus Kapabacteria bacterium]
MKNIKNRAALILIVIALIGSMVLILSSCMQTNSPSDTNNRVLTVQVNQSLGTGSKTIVPLSGVDVVVYDSRSNKLINSGKTLINGSVKFDIQAVPIIGQSITVMANYNNQPQSKSCTLCVDTNLVFVFDTTYITPLTCANLNKSDSLIFTDETGSRRLHQNNPVGINEYLACKSIPNDAANTDSIIATIPPLAAPFSYRSISIDNIFLQSSAQTVKIKPGSTLNICIAASTAAIGTFNTPAISIQLSCSASKGTYTIYPSALVVAPECNCTNMQTILIAEANAIKLGTFIERTDLVYTNNLSCDVTINQVSFSGSGAWTIESPTFPVSVAKGQKLSIKAKFTAVKVGKNTDVLKLNISPAGSTSCSLEIDYTGNGCTGACPQISDNRIFYSTFSTKNLIDTLSNRSDNRVMVSLTNVIPPINSKATSSYYVKNPDSSCTQVVVSLSILPGTDKDQYYQQYYSVSPSQLTLNPGETGSFDIIFTAPNLTDFKNIVNVRQPDLSKRTTADSAFNIVVQLQSPSCLQKINATAVISSLPSLSPIINLRAYNQITFLKPVAETEVYSFGNDARTILYAPGGGPAANPPVLGDIYISAKDNIPKPGITCEDTLKSVNNSVKMKVWSNWNPAVNSEADFTDVSKVMTLVNADANFKTGYTTNPVFKPNLAIGNVIAFQLNSFTYALMFIRRVDVGTEPSSSQQSGIEFRTIYPIYMIP